MKETRFFYVPDALTSTFLPEEEAAHAIRVLRLAEGDKINLIDGYGHMVEAIISQKSAKNCQYFVENIRTMPPMWTRKINICVAPTKNIDRMEWFVEKATEIGVDSITMLDCRFSERKQVKTQRLEKIIISAVKQSHKYYTPTLNDMTAFSDLINTPFEGQRFIAHCYDEPELLSKNKDKPYLLDLLQETNKDMQVLIGPEGDFSVDEVKQAIALGFVPISLGSSRLRTETAAMVAVHLMRLVQR